MAAGESVYTFTDGRTVPDIVHEYSDSIRCVSCNAKFLTIYLFIIEVCPDLDPDLILITQ